MQSMKSMLPAEEVAMRLPRRCPGSKAKPCWFILPKARVISITTPARPQRRNNASWTTTSTSSSTVLLSGLVLCYWMVVSLPRSMQYFATAQTVKINVFTARSPDAWINGGFTVRTSGSLTNLSGLAYRDTYQIRAVFNAQNALAMKSNALGVIGESTMFVDEYEVTAPNVTVLDVDSCRAFFADLEGAATYYPFDNSTQNTTAFFGIHQNKWLVLLPRGYRSSEQVTGNGTVYANNPVFADDGVPAKALIGNRKGSCGIRWTGTTGPTQSILVEFGEPAGATGGTTIQTQTNSTTNTTNASNTTKTNTTTTTASNIRPTSGGTPSMHRFDVLWSTGLGLGISLVLWSVTV